MLGSKDDCVKSIRIFPNTLQFPGRADDTSWHKRLSNIGLYRSQMRKPAAPTALFIGNAIPIHGTAPIACSRLF